MCIIKAISPSPFFSLRTPKEAVAFAGDFYTVVRSAEEEHRTRIAKLNLRETLSALLRLAKFQLGENRHA